MADNICLYPEKPWWVPLVDPDPDLEMIYQAGMYVHHGVWAITGCRPHAIAHAALMVCEAPERHTDAVLNWAIETLSPEWPN